VWLRVGSGIGSVVERMRLCYARPPIAVDAAIAAVQVLLRCEEVTFPEEASSLDGVGRVSESGRSFVGSLGGGRRCI
jgi:hypothetical protein